MDRHSLTALVTLTRSQLGLTDFLKASKNNKKDVVATYEVWRLASSAQMV